MKLFDDAISVDTTLKKYSHSEKDLIAIIEEALDENCDFEMSFLLGDWQAEIQDHVEIKREGYEELAKLFINGNEIEVEEVDAEGIMLAIKKNIIE